MLIYFPEHGDRQDKLCENFRQSYKLLESARRQPCNECANCKMSLNEETMDIVEMDAASNRRIDDIRQLRDVVVYPPANLKYRLSFVTNCFSNDRQ